MIIGAILIGLITAYYFGLRNGGIAAGVSFSLFLLALAMPNMLLWIYGFVGVALSFVLVLGPRMPNQKKKKADFLRFGRKATGALFKTIRRFTK